MLIKRNTYVFCMAALIIFAIELPNPLALLTGNKSEIKQALLKDIENIAAPGEVGTLCVFDTNAEVIVSAPYTPDKTDYQAAIVAAGTLEKGRIVVFPHKGYLDVGSFKDNDTLPMLVNCINWCAGKKGGNDPKVCIHDNEELAGMLSGRGINAVNLDTDDWTSKLDDADVIICLADFNLKTARILEQHVLAGQGLICAMTGWEWPGDIPGRTMRNMPANSLLSKAGIVFTSDSITTPKEGLLAAKLKGSDLIHTAVAIDALEKNINDGSQTNQSMVSSAIDLLEKAASAVQLISKEQSCQIIKSVSLMYDCVPETASEKYKLKINALMHRAIITAKSISPANPVKNEAAYERCVIAINNLISRTTPAAKVRWNPFASQFPENVPTTARRISQEVSMNVGVPGWHSTGLYAAPGDKVIIILPPSSTGMNFKALLGCHTDDLWDCDEWHRLPSITRQFSITSGTNIVANEFGGLIYIDIPIESTKNGVMKFKFIGACKAPYFRLGVNKPEDWKASIRNNPAPWAELATSKLIITVPSSIIRNLDNPEPVLRYWDSVMDAISELATIPTTRKYPERIIHDIQPGAGYKHSGYPIVAQSDTAPELFDLAKLKKDGSWVYFSKLAHNHQDSSWTFEGTLEVTKNLFCLYITEKLNSGLPGSAHAKLTPECLKGYRSIYNKDDGKFADWKTDPFLGLLMYTQLKDAFGWDTFKKVFTEYRNISEERKPQTNDDKRDEWLTRLSMATGKNLTEFFDKWSIPVSDDAKEEVKDLPVWMPEETK